MPATLDSMVRAVLRSAGYAFRGVVHAFVHERNIRLFLVPYALVLLLGARVHVERMEWIALLFAGGMFFVSELLNTAIERLADIVDEHWKREGCQNCCEAVKIAKDVAAAASLVSLLVTIVVVLIVFVPKL